LRSDNFACLVFALMGVFFHALNNMEEAKSLAREMLHPARKKPNNPNLFYALAGTCAASFLAGVGSGVNGNYQLAAWCFTGAWFFATVAVIVGGSIFSQRARVAWSLIAAIVFAIIFSVLYLVVCPTLRISPSNAKFLSVGELYSFRIENKSDHDVYMSSSLFYLDSAAYNTSDFDFQVEQDSLKPLAQQLDGVDYGVPDIFGVSGFVPQSEDRHFFLFYIYHLGPRESRSVTIRLKQHKLSTNQTINVSTEVMSYSDKAVPVTKDSIANSVVVYVPALIKRPLAISGFLRCYIKQDVHIPCENLPAARGAVGVPEGCMSFAVVSQRQTIPQKILPGKCEL
jgi:hypothetical protein